MRRSLAWFLLTAVTLSGSACATFDIPQAHKGRIFRRTGLFTLYSGPTGLTGPVLGPGTHFAGVYSEFRAIDCSMNTVREPIDTMTHDGVHFGFTVMIRFSTDCSDQAVPKLLETLTPDRDEVVTSGKIYATFVQPAIFEAAREFVSPYRANDLNDQQAQVTAGIRKRFLELMSTREKQAVVIHEVNVVELRFPREMDSANLDRAVQSLLRDKAIAERERVQAEVETTRMRAELAARESDVTVVRIERIGEALRRHPEYMQYDLQQKLPDIYREAGQRGNMVLAAPYPAAGPLPAPLPGASRAYPLAPAPSASLPRPWSSAPAPSAATLPPPADALAPKRP